MRTRLAHPSAAVPGAIVLVILAAAWGCGGSSPAAPTPSSTPPATLPEMVMGSATAPITMLDYSSLTCSHCADFQATTLQAIKSTYIDAGQVRVVFREFPLNNGAALSAAMVARCSADKYFTVVDLLYASQAVWAGAANVSAALKSVVAPAGVSAADVDACLARSDLKTAIQAMKTEGENKYGIAATPTFIINEKTKVEGAMPYGTFDMIFRGLL
jgi:protein-disulfide isomerase